MNPELKEAAERLRLFIREHLKGGCRMYSQGSACQCPLCDLERIIPSEEVIKAATTSPVVTDEGSYDRYFSSGEHIFGNE